MKLKLPFWIIIFLFISDLQAQESPDSILFRKFPITAGLHFHNFAVPFKDLGSNFQHPGFFAGTELDINKKRTWFVNLNLGFYQNKEMGNGMYTTSQFCYQPHLFDKLFFRLQGGLGYAFVFHPVQAYQYENGSWEEVGGGKSQLLIPFDFATGYTIETTALKFSPFISYQVSVATNYNETIPTSFYTSFLAGCRFYLQKS